MVRAGDKNVARLMHAMAISARYKGIQPILD